MKHVHILYSNCKLNILCILTGTPHFLVKTNTVMWQVLWLSPSSERTRPYFETSERKLRGIAFFGTGSKLKDEIEKFHSAKEFPSSALYLNQSFFKNSYSTLRNCLPYFYFDNFQSTLDKIL